MSIKEIKPACDVCVRCATCMSICPVSRVTGRFPGPKQAGPGAERFRNPGESSVDNWIELCLGCRLCETVCSSGVPVSELNLLARAKYLDEQGRPFRDWLLTHSHRLNGLGSLLAPLVNPLLTSRPVKWFLDRFLRIDGRMNLPPYESQSFRRWFRSRPGNSSGEITVGYFYGCYINVHEVDVGRATVEVLEACGRKVILPPQDCCGIPLLGHGDLAGAARLGNYNLRSFGELISRGEDIIFASPSCGLMIRHEYDRILALPGAREAAGHIFDIFEYLSLNEDCRAALSRGLSPLDKKAAYFVPCHLKALNIGLPAFELLSLIPGLKLDLLEADCCGLAGAFGFKKEKYDISQAIGRDLTRAAERIKPDIIVSECEGCRMQIRSLTGLEVRHPVEVLRDALGSRP